MAFIAPFVAWLGTAAGTATVSLAAAGAGAYAAHQMAKAATAPVRKALAPAPAAPTVSNSADQLDAAARSATSGMAGRTSTVLAPSGTAEEDAKKTSKVLLGT